ncbi:CLUMA_CG009515, isoform A [Clunio marinus]|uniref:CLUMA_CG009515, isoform A n=1 Tax=Clunio marinus TaxID=568069 RepID=A0A1J1I6Z6_9DIPT|nr:CLUMA_CG009515, isoform A [Clunio marinus]
MTSSSPNNRVSSPGSSNDDTEQNQTPPPLQMPPEIRIFQQQNCPENNNLMSEQNYQTEYQTPTLNSKKSFCIDALLARNHNDSESDLENKRSYDQFRNNNYKDNIISRDLNGSPDDQMSSENIRSRSDSPVSSTRSSPPISPGCEEQNQLPEGFIQDESFKRPIPPDMRHPGFPPQFYNMYQPQLLLPNNSAFHRPDGSGKSISMPGFVPHLSNLELIRQAGIFYPRITDLTGELKRKRF